MDHQDSFIQEMLNATTALYGGSKSADFASFIQSALETDTDLSRLSDLKELDDSKQIEVLNAILKKRVPDKADCDVRRWLMDDVSPDIYIMDYIEMWSDDLIKLRIF